MCVEFEPTIVFPIVYNRDENNIFKIRSSIMVGKLFKKEANLFFPNLFPSHDQCDQWKVAKCL